MGRRWRESAGRVLKKTTFRDSNRLQRSNETAISFRVSDRNADVTFNSSETSLMHSFCFSISLHYSKKRVNSVCTGSSSPIVQVTTSLPLVATNTSGPRRVPHSFLQPQLNYFFCRIQNSLFTLYHFAPVGSHYPNIFISFYIPNFHHAFAFVLVSFNFHPFYFYSANWKRFNLSAVESLHFQIFVTGQNNSETAKLQVADTNGSSVSIGSIQNLVLAFSVFNLLCLNWQKWILFSPGRERKRRVHQPWQFKF